MKMTNSNFKAKNFYVLVLFSMFGVTFWYFSFYQNIRLGQPVGTAILQGKQVDLTQIFVAQGNVYNSKRPLALLNSLVDRLKGILEKPFITMVDIPCGDLYWMRHFIGQRTDVHYTGIDIVPTLIQRHKTNFGNIKNAQFINLDIVTAGLNQSYDIIFCREMLQHLTTADALKVLEHFSISGSKILITTNALSSENVEIITGGGRFRPLNLMLPPVNLVPPVCSIRDTLEKNGIKELSIWTLPLKQRA